MSVQLRITIGHGQEDPQPTEPGHYVVWTDDQLERRILGPMAGYTALSFAQDRVADPGCSEVTYIALTGARHGEDAIRQTMRRRR